MPVLIIHIKNYPMKKIRLAALAAVVFLLFTTSCQRDALNETGTMVSAAEESAINKKNDPAPCNPGAYAVTLESRTLVNGAWEWIWSIQNLNPGNGNNGTAQDLSHWGIQLGTCINPSSITGAAYSADGINWTTFTPVNQPETSQPCLTTPVLKFDFGTTGTAKSYYRLTLSQEYPAGTAFGYFKAGSRCCTFNFTGIACGGPVEIEVVE